MDDAEQSVEYTGSDLKALGRKWLNAIAASEKREKSWIDDATKAEKAYLCDDEANQFNILHSNVETIIPSLYNSTPSPDIRSRFGVDDDAIENVAEIYDRVIRYQIDDGRLDGEIEATVQDIELAGRGIVRAKFDFDETETGPTNERILYEVVSWRDYREGPAKRWADVPWVAYRHEVSEEERQRLEDETLTKEQEEFKPETSDKDCTVWEIWCKETRKVYFIVGDSGTVLRATPDPLRLQGFFPQPQPVQPITATGKRTPVCPYASYDILAEELDKVTTRINNIMDGLKVRGIFVGNAQAIEDLADLGDNELMPAADIEGLLAMGGLDKAVLWWPIETAVAVLRELYLQRDQTKEQIYELTGISDIVRGASKSNETATAQQIKTEWGSLRIKRKQNRVQRMIRDLFVISAEIISQFFTAETLQRISGLPITEAEMQYLQKPLDFYRIDVETDSTIRADLTKSRAEMSEFLQGTAAFFQTMAPIVAGAPQAAAPLARMYQAFAQQFNLGKSAEDALEQFVDMAEQASEQPAPDPNSEAMAAQEAEMNGKMAELQLKAKEVEIKAMEMRLDNDTDLQIKGAEIAQKDRDSELRAQIEAAKLELEREKLGLERERIAFDASRQVQEQQQPVSVNVAEMATDGLAEAMMAALQAVMAEAHRGHADLAQGQQALAQIIADSNSQMVAALTAPKEIVRDDEGRPVGARVVVS